MAIFFVEPSVFQEERCKEVTHKAGKVKKNGKIVASQAWNMDPKVIKIEDRMLGG